MSFRAALFVLHELPDLEILALILLIVTGLTMAAPHIGRHIFRFARSADRDSEAFDAFKAIMATTSVVLAFSLVQADSNLHAASALVDKEGSAISETDRTLLRSGVSDLVALRPLVAAYAQSLIDDEWPALHVGGQSEKTDQAFTALSRKARAFAPANARETTVFEELLRHLDAVADARSEVVTASEAELPTFFWVTTFGLLLLGVGVGTLCKSSLERTVSLGATATAVALLLAFVVIVDRPFEGQTSVGPDAIKKAMVIAAKRQP